MRNNKDKMNDFEICKELWKLLDEADVVIGHNGDAFDIKKTNAIDINNVTPIVRAIYIFCF